MCGSSPLTRGTQKLEISPSQKFAVHPRLRGELEEVKRLRAERLRFIPAYAGNSMELNKPMFCSPVHPRLRGELCVSMRSFE